MSNVLDELFTRLKYENPRASDEELKKLFVEAATKPPGLLNELAKWYFDKEYDAMLAAKEH